MGAVAYAEAFGQPGDEPFYRQLRATGIPLLTHVHDNADLFPYERVEVVPMQRRVVDSVVAGVRKLKTRHGYRLPMSMELQLMDRMLQLGATTIHAHRGAAAARIAPVGRRLDCRLIATFHDGELPEEAPSAYRKAIADVFKEFARILAVSPAVERQLRELGCPEDKLEVVPFGVALRPMRPRRTRTNGTPVRAITVTPLHPANGVAELVDAVALARRMGANLTLDIVGDGTDRDKVQRHIERSGLGKEVALRGDLVASEMHKLLDGCDLFVLNRRAPEGEELPASLLEAMASGLCIVTTKTGGVSDAIRDHVTGVLLDKPDTSKLASALVDTARDAALRSALGAAGRACVERDFDLARGVERLFELYQ